MFQCLPMYWGKEGRGETKCVGMCFFFLLFFFSNAEFMDEVKFLCFLYWNAFFCAELLYHKTVQ